MVLFCLNSSSRQRLKEISSLSLTKEFSNFTDLKNFLQYESTDLVLIDPSENEYKIFKFIEQYGIQKQVVFTSKNRHMLSRGSSWEF